MLTNFDADCKLTLYADDSTILFAHKDPDFISHKLSKVLDQTSNWLVENKLSCIWVELNAYLGSEGNFKMFKISMFYVMTT
jgi:hypothetical protein